jgi:zinc protease
VKYIILLFSFCLISCAVKPNLDSLPKASHVVQLRNYKFETLPNGLNLIFVEDQILPRVSLQAHIGVGLLHEPMSLAGINAVTSAMLDQGTTRMTAEQLSLAFNQLGTEFSGAAEEDASEYSVSSLAADRKQLLALFAEVLMSPRFASEEAKKIKSLFTASIQKKKDSPASVANMSYDEFLYDKHPYARTTLGTEQSIANIQTEDIKNFYRAWYTPDRVTIMVAGRFDEEYAQSARNIFSSWSKSKIKADPVFKVESVSSQKRLKFVSKKDLVQAQIRIGQIQVQRNDPDFLPLMLAAEILGGGFASRLMKRVRNELGLTYSISASMDAKKTTGDFTISTFTKNDSVEKAIDEVLGVVKKLHTEGASAKELALAQSMLMGQYPRYVETADSTAAQLASLHFYGFPLTHLQSFPDRVKKVELARLNDVIKRRLNPDQMKIIVYGDEGILQEQLQKWMQVNQN